MSIMLVDIISSMGSLASFFDRTWVLWSWFAVASIGWWCWITYLRGDALEAGESPASVSTTAIRDRALPRTKALLMGYYGVGNLGDEMMFFCLRPWLEAQGFELTIVSERPDDVCRAHALPAVENSPLLGEWSWRTSWFGGGAWRLIQAIRNCDALIIGGGDLIRDDLGWRTFFYTLEKILLATFLGKKVYLVNAGIGEPKTYYGRAILRWVLPRCQQIIVRDFGSVNVCKRFGSEQNVTFAPDIVLGLPRLLIQHPHSLPLAHITKPYIVVSLRYDSSTFHSYSLTDERVRTVAASLDALIRQHGIDVIFVPFYENVATGRGDNQLHQRVVDAMQHADRVHLRPWSANIADVAHCIANAQFVLAMRLHAAVLARAYGRPAVLMPYDKKVREFGELMKIQLVLEATTLDDPSFVIDHLQRAWIDSQQQKLHYSETKMESTPFSYGAKANG
jgi:polysaccharide pyruvyl transferase CsaB